MSRSLNRTWIALTGIADAMFFCILFVVPRFRDLFKGFGADLPWPTRVLLDYHAWIAVFLVFGLVLCALLVWRQEDSPDSSRLTFVVLANLAVACVLNVLAVVALYLPIFQLGSAI